MAELIVFHHALGLTDGVRSWAAALREEGHTVQTPDLYEGRTFANLAAGVAFAEEIGFETVIDRGVAAAGDAGPGIVFCGFSLGVLPAQKLAQSRPDARGAVLISAAVPPAMFGSAWPDTVPVQIHLMEQDPFVVDEDLPAAQELVAEAADGELFIYEGSEHLFFEAGVPNHRPEHADELKARVLEFLERIG